MKNLKSMTKKELAEVLNQLGFRGNTASMKKEQMISKIQSLQSDETTNTPSRKETTVMKKAQTTTGDSTHDRVRPDYTPSTADKETGLNSVEMTRLIEFINSELSSGKTTQEVLENLKPEHVQSYYKHMLIQQRTYNAEEDNIDSMTNDEIISAIVNLRTQIFIEKLKKGEIKKDGKVMTLNDYPASVVQIQKYVETVERIKRLDTTFKGGEMPTDRFTLSDRLGELFTIQSKLITANQNAPATEGQVKLIQMYMNSLHFEADLENMTKSQAKALIDEHKAEFDVIMSKPSDKQIDFYCSQMVMCGAWSFATADLKASVMQFSRKELSERIDTMKRISTCARLLKGNSGFQKFEDVYAYLVKLSAEALAKLENQLHEEATCDYYKEVIA